MYKFLGYVIKDNEGNVVNFSKNRTESITVCRNSRLSESNIHQVYEFKKVDNTQQSDTSPDIVDFT